MTQRYLIAREWKTFAAANKLDTVSRIQREAMQRAFYGGAYGLLTAVSRIADQEAYDETLMERVHEELREFAESVLTETLSRIMAECDAGGVQ